MIFNSRATFLTQRNSWINLQVSGIPCYSVICCSKDIVVNPLCPNIKMCWLSVYYTTIRPFPHESLLNVILNSDPTFLPHNQSLYKSCCIYLHGNSKIRVFLTEDTIKLLIFSCYLLSWSLQRSPHWVSSTQTIPPWVYHEWCHHTHPPYQPLSVHYPFCHFTQPTNKIHNIY